MPGNVDFWKSADALNRFMKEKLCLAQSASEPCEGGIVAAHTVARSQLEKIAVGGHVKAFNASAAQLDKNDGEISVKDVGISQFSTLNCFCAMHDRTIFSDVENVPLTFSPLQLATLHYRAIASELYRKTQGHKGTLNNIDLFEKQTGQAARNKVTFVKAMSAGEELAIRDMTGALNRASAVLDSQHYGLLAALVVRFKRPPSIMTVSAFFPEVDFDGKRLSKLGDRQRIYELASFHILAADDGNAAIVFVWRKSDLVGRAFVESYLRQETRLYTTLAIQFTYECFENMCMAPAWWSNLKKVEQDLLTERMKSLGNGGDRYLEFSGVVYDDWEFAWGTVVSS